MKRSIVITLLAASCVSPYQRETTQDLEEALAEAEDRIDELEDVVGGLALRLASIEAAGSGDGARVDDLLARVDELEDELATFTAADGQSCWDLDGDGLPDVLLEDTNADGVVDVLDCRGGTGLDGVSCWDVDGNGVADVALEDVDGSGTVDVGDCVGPSGSSGSDGLSCWDFDADGVGDAFEDLNGDLVFDVRDCQGSEGPPGPDGTPCWDLDGDGVGDPGEDVDESGSFDASDCRPEPLPGGGTGLEIDSTNFEQIAPRAADRVQVLEIISLSGNYDGLDVGALDVHGGGFTGTTGAAVVEVGRRSIFHGTRFENVRIDGFGVTFVDCDFVGAIELPADARVQASRFTDVVLSSDSDFEVIENSEFDGSTISRGRRFEGNLVDTSTISSDVWYVTGNVIDDSTVFVADDGSVTGNYFDRTLVHLSPESSGLIDISSNKFDGPLTGETTNLRLEVPETAFIAVNVSGNSFTVQSGTPSSIEVLGTTSGGFQYQVVHILGNTFLKGTAAVSYGSTIRTVVRENVTRATSVGVTSSGNLVVGENTEL